MDLTSLFMKVHFYRDAEIFNGEILFISDLEGKPNLYTYRDGEFINLTRGYDRIGGYRKDTKLKVILLIHDIGGNERWRIKGIKYLDGSTEDLFEIGDGVSINIPSRINGDRGIFAYASNRRNPSLFDTYIYHLRDGEERLIFEGSPNTYPISFSPKGDILAVIKSSGTWEQILYFIDTEDGALIDSFIHEDTHISNIEWVDNDRIYMITDYDSDSRYIAEYTIGGGIEEIWKADGEIELFKIFNDNLIYTVNISGDSKLYIGEDEISKPLGVVTHIDVDKSIVISLNTVRYGESIWILDNDKLKPLKYCNILEEIGGYIVEPSVVRSRMSDGLYVESLIYRSRKENGYIFIPHGGPESQSRPIFNPLIQILINRGYTVIQPNYRGSTGYGKLFRHLDDKRRRERSLKDIVDVLYDLKSRKLIGDGPVGILGGSYGGFATLYLITHYPDLWKAAVSVVGISNLETFLKNTGPWRKRLREREYGSLEEDIEFLRKISPIYYIDNIKAPLLLIHGRNDSRVPVEESIQIYNRLKELGREVDIHIFEDEGHGITKIENRKVYIERVLDWFTRYLRDI